MKKNPSGFTLIELIVTMAIFAIICTLAIPSFQIIIANKKIRNLTESIADGLRIAQTNAIKTNIPTEFKLTQSNWTILQNSQTVESFDWGENTHGWSDEIQLTTSPTNSTTIRFNGIGRPIANVDGLKQIDVAMPLNSDTRAMRVEINVDGFRTCDPALTIDDPKGCHN